MGATNTAEREPTLATGLLPIAGVADVADEFQEIAVPEPLCYIERPSLKAYKYGRAHSFIASVSNAQIIGSGSLVVEGNLVVHGLSSGNYAWNIEHQLRNYRTVPDGGAIDEECVLVWGCNNFGHWIFTYLLRLTLLWRRPELMGMPILLHESVPRRFREWITRMGFKNVLIAKDGVRVRKLWIPSVICYRGHYEDKMPYIDHQSVHVLRKMVLKDLEYPSPRREMIYLSRAKDKWRKLVNEDEFWQMLEGLGFRRVFLQDLSIEDQLDVVSRASVIVIHAGGASPTTMFAPMDCKIFEVTLPQFVGTFASRCWAHVLGQEFYRMNITSIDEPRKIEDGFSGESIVSGLTGNLTIDRDGLVDVESAKAGITAIL